LDAIMLRFSVAASPAAGEDVALAAVVFCAAEVTSSY
jgi:hypothetical protein